MNPNRRGLALGLVMGFCFACSDDASLGNDSANEGVTRNEADDDADDDAPADGSGTDGSDASSGGSDDDPAPGADDDGADDDGADDDGAGSSNTDPGDSSDPIGAAGAPGTTDDDPDGPNTSMGGSGSVDPEPSATGDDPEPDMTPPEEDCEQIQCFRAIKCVEVCGGPVLAASCCPCAEGTFDSIECMSSGGASGGGGTSGGGGAGGSGGTGASAGAGGRGGTAGVGSGTAGRNTGGAGGYDLSLLNTECVDDECEGGLTPVHFFGIAGPSGPEFCWCTIPCAEDPDMCPETTSCVTVADGPGEVCYENEPE